MSTSMPYIEPVKVTTEHVEIMRDLGPDSLLVWHESTGRAEVCPPTGDLGNHTMIIAPGRALGDLTETREDDEETCDDTMLAEDLTDIANDWLSDWAQVRAMTPILTPIRRRLDKQGIYPAHRVDFDHQGNGLPTIADTYARPGGRTQVRVAVPLGYTEPVRLDVRTLGDYATVSDLALQFDYARTTAERNEALIAATVTALLSLDNA